MRTMPRVPVARSTYYAALVALAAGCSNGGGTGDGAPSDSATDTGVVDVVADSGPNDVVADTGAVDATDVTADVPADVATEGGGDGGLGSCEISPAVAAHVSAMSTMGWSAQNRSSGMLMYGCPAGSMPGDCLASVPLAGAGDIGANRNAVTGTHLRVLFTATNASQYWTRISADGRFIARGTHVRDMTRGVDIETNPPAMYDPGFFPDNSRFFYQPNGRTCPMSVLTTGTPTRVAFTEPGCTTTLVGLYEHLGVALGGGDYWATSAGSAAWDNGGHTATLNDPPPNSPWLSRAQTTLSLMANTGTTFVNTANVSLPTPYQGDGVLSPSSLLVMTRVADMTGQTQIGYRLHRLNATHTGSAVMATLTPIANYCFLGAKPAFSLDEHWVVMHHYVTDADAMDLGFTGPTDPGFAAYQTQGASNIYLLNLTTGVRTRLTNMGPGQYALYPAFRSDGWIYFIVRTLGTGTEYSIASDAALILP